MSIEEKSLNILVVGPGREFFSDIAQDNQRKFADAGLSLGVSEGFSAPEITNVVVSIGIGVLSGLSTHYISKMVDSIFGAKKKAADSGVQMTINVTVNNGDQYMQVGSDRDTIKQEITKIVVHNIK